MCPGCEAPLDLQRPAGDTSEAASVVEDVLECAGCGCTFVVRFGHALTLPGTVNAGVA